MSEATNLRPCPFCGGDRIDAAFAKGTTPGGANEVAAGCWTCSAVGPGAATKEEAAERWNRRKSPPEVRVVADEDGMLEAWLKDD